MSSAARIQDSHIRPRRLPLSTTTPFHHRFITALFAIGMVGALLGAGTARAQTWLESGDAPELPATAQVTSGTGPLTEIDGNLLDDADVDMYCIKVTDPLSFFAQLQCVIIQGPDIRLFNAGGVGASANFLCQASAKYVSGAFANTAGTYYLAVCYRGKEAFAGPDAIWLASNLAEHAPDGPGAAGVVNGWGGIGLQAPINPYRIFLSGATFCDNATPTHARSWGALKLIYR